MEVISYLQEYYYQVSNILEYRYLLAFYVFYLMCVFVGWVTVARRDTVY